MTMTRALMNTIDSSQTVTIHPSGLASEGDGGFAPNGSYTWANALDSNDGDTSYVWSGGAFYNTFYVDMDDPGIGGSPTINSVTVKVVVKNSTAFNVDIGYKTGTNVIWKGDTHLHDPDFGRYHQLRRRCLDPDRSEQLQGGGLM
jgi:hypothetical protein